MARDAAAGRIRRALAVIVPVFTALVIVAACGNDRPDQAGGGGALVVPQGDRCATPNEGCACDEPGKIVDCGTVEMKSGDYVSCSMGHRTCVGTQWGACQGTSIVQTKVAAGGASALHGLGLGSSTLCPPPPSPLANPCDPYCNSFVDDPIGLNIGDGGLAIIDGGLTITPAPTVDAGDGGIAGGGPPIFTGTDGKNSCAGSADEITNPCNATNAAKNCQQDFHCDLAMGSPTYQTCVWNEPSYYSDATCNGVDLTIGAGCDQGPTSYVIPVCNRGTKPLSAGANIKIGIVGSGGFSTWNAACGGGVATSCSFTLTSPLGPGQCVTTSSCPGGTGQRWAIVNADNSIAECGAPGAGCNNNAAQIKDVGSGCVTCACNSGTAELTGIILDPAKLRPVYGATLYVPSSAVTAFAPNVGCDTCANVYSGLPALASTTTDVDGRFRLQGVPAGKTFPVVLQLGRFRRQLTVGPIAACGSAVLGAAQSHLPATHTKAGDTAADSANPDLPKIAIITGNGDATECLLARMGFATSEFTDPAGSGQFHMYKYTKTNGLTGTTGTFSGRGSTVTNSGAADALLGSAAALAQYNALLMPCANGNTNPTAGQQANLSTWLDGGGRFFASHHAVEDFVRYPAGNPNTNAANWAMSGPWASSNPDQSDRAPTYPLTDNINTSIPYGVGLARWLQIAWPAPGGPGGTTPAYGKIALPDYRHDVSGVPATSTSWFSGQTSYTGAGAGTQHNMISFDTPVSAPAANRCGRAVLPFMHVSSLSSNTFPANCGTVPAALTGQELTFEYMMWQSMTCISPSTVPPTAPPPTPPGPPTPLSPITFTRDYQAVCPVGTRVKWQFFYWQDLPLGGTIDFRAATADTQAMLPGAPAAAPVTVPIGTASAAVLPPSWGQDAQTVSDHLKLEGATVSKDWLRVFITFNPLGPLAPVLYAWRQTYDCVPAE
ncbi:MAG: hypothetical protein JWP97_4168 [Labilithrix sp.]|nr:hypothetical protein [Labilithrix sp.]